MTASILPGCSRPTPPTPQGSTTGTQAGDKERDPQGDCAGYHCPSSLRVSVTGQRCHWTLSRTLTADHRHCEGLTATEGEAEGVAVGDVDAIETHFAAKRLAAVAFGHPSGFAGERNQDQEHDHTHRLVEGFLPVSA